MPAFRRLSPETNPVVEALVRFGYATKGLVYFVIAALAMLAAAGYRSGRMTDSPGAVRTIGQQPFGAALLLIAAVGLGSYALWGLVEAWLDVDRDGRSPFALAKRAGYGLNGLFHAGLSLLAFQLFFGYEGDRGASNVWLVWLLDRSPPAAAVLGVGIGGFGLGQVGFAAFGDVTARLGLSHLDAAPRRWIQCVARAGTAAHGAVLAVIGWTLLRGAIGWSRDVRGFDGALAMIQDRPYGGWLVGLVAAGLALYGAYMLACAWFRWLGDEPGPGGPGRQEARRLAR